MPTMKKMLQVGAPVALTTTTAVISALLYQYAFKRADKTVMTTPLPPVRLSPRAWTSRLVWRPAGWPRGS